MNLVNEMIKGLLPEEEKKKVVAVYGGGFKPPTSGHFEVTQQALKESKSWNSPTSGETIFHLSQTQQLDAITEN